MPPDPQSPAPVHSLREVLSVCRFTQAPDLDLLDTSRLTDIQWRADRCTASSILCFQRFDDGRSDAEIIERYLLHSDFGALVINRPLAGTQDQDARWVDGSRPRGPQPDGLQSGGPLQAGSSQAWSMPATAVQTAQLAGRPVFVTAPDAWGETLERLCDHFYPVKPTHWQIAGVTGTNGKTTTIKYLESILLAAERRVLSIGTLGLTLNGQPQAETGFTSPPYIELRRILNDCRAQADTLVMEVSSHALHQGRVHGLRFAAAAWTNFSQDHLDYHGDEASYFAAKALILDQIADEVPLLTTSVEVAQRLRAERGPEVPVMRIAPPSLPTEDSDDAESASLLTDIDPVSCGDRTEDEPTSAVDLAKPTNSPPAPAAELSAEALRASPFLALGYNRANYALACALATRLLGTEPLATWQALQPVPGRFDCYVDQHRTIVIDFAHTPDALENILSAIRAAFPSAGVLTLFGCGGDRDRAKRPLMGAAVCRGSDQVILTSDNPRFEDPRSIVDDTLAGMSHCNSSPTVILDRAEAITRLFDRLAERPDNEPWVALIAGKGHEPYIDQNGVKRPYSDREQVLKNLQRLGWNS